MPQIITTALATGSEADIAMAASLLAAIESHRRSGGRTSDTRRSVDGTMLHPHDQGSGFDPERA